ncbi:NADH-quinone oxidoreductase subunit A [Uliginosibacterium aquaticum]
MSSSLIVGTRENETPALMRAFCNEQSSHPRGSMMLNNYFPVLLFIAVGLAVGVAPMMLGRLLGPHRPDPQKLTPYECGFEPFEEARMRFDVRYYLIAILFILFDLEVAFLLPWASIVKELAGNEAVRLFGFYEMFVFLGILVIGYVYVWKKGALDWE